MDVDRTAAKLGVGLATAPVVTMVAVVSFLELVYTGLVSPAQSDALLATLLGPLFTTNVLVVFGVVLVAPAVAFYLTFPEERDAGPVVAGFAVGALVYGVGVAGVGALGGMRPPVEGHARFGTWLALLFGGAAALGALGGDTVGPLFRSPEGADGEHPRW